eukprot:CAMPEP_0195506730 /NCGR_PEP_ID=MMETSP0794_2-20130614/301_1 /TAXON_ID=515487 /ORGANISM="Stephanopyxis turris, Strain CCMP 815" /LENGTH=297 /DNA_ID=CAMNT_0040633145 /DNA_START=205 /DNA_END=1099 /DNA_ORIENTATION=-
MHNSTTTPITKSGSDEEKQVLFHLDTKEQQTLPTNNKAADGEVIIPPNIGILTLNRPNAANAFSQRMVSELRAVLDQIRFQENDVRCVVLTSSSSKVFSAGADLKERSSMTQDEAGDFVSQLRGTFDDIANLPMPVVAAIEGVAVGGGLEMALAADIRVAGSLARFGLPETSLAIIPGAGGTQRLPRLIGTARAKELIFTGRRIDADTALQYGLIQHKVKAGISLPIALSIAQEIAKNGPLAIRAAKQAIDVGMEASDLSEGMSIERECYSTIIPTNDRLEGLNAFREGRTAVYTGK